MCACFILENSTSFLCALFYTGKIPDSLLLFIGHVLTIMSLLYAWDEFRGCLGGLYY